MDEQRKWDKKVPQWINETLEFSNAAQSDIWSSSEKTLWSILLDMLGCREAEAKQHDIWNHTVLSISLSFEDNPITVSYFLAYFQG